MPVGRMDSDRERFLHHVNRIRDHVRHVPAVGSNRGRGVEEMKTTFTRRELVHTGIEQIRIRLKIYEKEEDMDMIHRAGRLTFTMQEFGIIGSEKQQLLYSIINREFVRMLELQKRKSCARRQTGQSQNQPDYNIGSLGMK